MAEYLVTGSGKNDQGDITSLCGSWGTKGSATVIQAIRLGDKFYVNDPAVGRVDIKVMAGTYGPYLRTDPDKTIRNNLDSLRPC